MKGFLNLSSVITAAAIIMKFFLFIFFTSLFFINLSCRKTPEPEYIKPEIYWGTATAVKNGKPYQADIYAHKNLANNKNLVISYTCIKQGLYFTRISRYCQNTFYAGKVQDF